MTRVEQVADAHRSFDVFDASGRQHDVGAGVFDGVVAARAQATDGQV